MKGKRRGIFLKGLLWFGAVGGLCLGLAVAGILGLYVKRVEVANVLLKKAPAPFAVSVEGIEHEGWKQLELRGVEVRAVDVALRVEGVAIEREGKIGVSGLAVRTAGREEATLVVEAVDVGFTAPKNWRDIGKWTVDSVVISKPVAVVDEVAMGAVEGLLADLGGEKEEVEGSGASALPEIVIGKLRVEEGRAEVMLDGLLVPRVALGFELEGRGLRVTGSGPPSEEALRIGLRDVVLGDVEAPVARLPKIEVAVWPGEGFRGGRVEPFAVNGLEVNLTPEVFAMLKGKEGERVVERSPALRSLESEEGWVVEGVEIAGGRFSLAGFDGSEEGVPVLPDVVFGFEVEIEDLRVGGGEVKSAATQRVRLTDIAVAGGAAGEEEAIVGKIESIVAEVIPDRFFAEGSIEKLHVARPSVDVTSATMARFMGRESDGGKAVAPETGDSEGKRAFVVKNLAVEEGVFSVDPEIAGQAIPVTGGTFSVSMREGEAPEGDALYRATVGGLMLKNPREETENLVRLETVEVDFSAMGLQGGKRIESIRLSGMRVAIDSALQEMFEKEEGASEAPKKEEKKAGARLFQGWTLGGLTVEDTRITISDLLPDIPPISFDVKIEEENLVLGDDKSETGETMRMVEVPRVEIPSPRNSFVKVADLRNIFVEFSLEGLLNREIEEIHITDPRIFVGEHLFWYVDYTRKFNEERLKRDAAAAAAGELDEAEGGAWKVKRFVASNGKMLISPKGYPIVGIHPFPFNVNSDLESGDIDLELEIEDGTYTLSRLGVELTLVGLKGSAVFNVPFKQKDNNLWQYFFVDKMKFRNYEADNVELKVTYYEGGMSALFGGNAYEGYVNGGVNVYIREKYAWDAWLAMTDVDLGPVTELAVPETFVIDATVSGQVIAAGEELNLGLADVYLEKLSPGNFQITKLNELLEDLPPEWSELKKAAVGIGVTQLRDFQFDVGGGGLGYFDSTVALEKSDLKVSPFFETIDFPDREPAGFLTLNLEGPGGLRSLQLNYFDRTVDKKANKVPLNASNP